MIISDTHRYLFVEQPHTACTAIQAELRAHYGGQRILERHSTYADFLRVATPEQKRYFVFSGIRNPLDEAVSLYFKFRTDHKAKYTTGAQAQTLSQRQIEAYALVVGEQADFDRFIRRFYRRPFDNETLIYHHHMDEIIRFEHLQEDFSRTLARLGLEQIRPLPLVNKTGQRGDYLDYYPPSLRPQAARVFGPYMRKWGYDLPAEWTGITVPRSSFVLFRLLGAWRYVYRRYLRSPTNPATRLIAAIGSTIRHSAFRHIDR